MGGGRAEIADLNADGLLDIVFCNAMHNYRPDQEAFIYWGSTSGFDAAKRTALPAYRASGVAVGDLNGDGLPDIAVVTYSPGILRLISGTGQVIWSTGSSDDLQGQSGAAIGDLDGDGRTDLAVAVHQGQGTFNGTSRAWLGDGRRGFREIAGGFRTSGTTDVAIAGGRKTGERGRVIFCNSIGGRFDEAVLHVEETCDGRLIADHTYVPGPLRGQGIAKRLVARLVDDARNADLKIVPICAFVRMEKEKHPEWGELFV